jgi:hypothetical protein
LDHYFVIIMADHPTENIVVALLDKVNEHIEAAAMVLENDVGPYDINDVAIGDEPTRSHRMDNLIDHISDLRDVVERLSREYRTSLDSARETILLAISQVENGTRPLSVPIAVRPLIVASQQWGELHGTPASEVIDQVFGGLTARIRWRPFYFVVRDYLARRPYRRPNAIDGDSDNDSLFSDVPRESE